MIKNKALNIKIIFKNIKNRLKTFQFSNIPLFYKTFKNRFQKQFLKIIFQNYFKKQLPNKPTIFFTCFLCF